MIVMVTVAQLVEHWTVDPGVGSSNLLSHPFNIEGDRVMAKEKERKYPCPKCETGELFDANAGGMFGAMIECDNPKCDYTDDDGLIGCVTG